MTTDDSKTTQIHIGYTPPGTATSVSVAAPGKGWVDLWDLPPGDPLRIAVRAALIQSLGVACGLPAGEATAMVIVGNDGASHAYYARRVTGLEALGVARILHEVGDKIEAKTMDDMSAPPPAPKPPKPPRDPEPGTGAH